MALAFLAFALAIAINAYFQKIADPKDIAFPLDFSFTISHIVVVVIAAAFEFVWLINHSYVFLVVAGMAMLFLVLALMVLRHPDTDHIALVNYSRAHLTGAESAAGPRPRRIDEDFHG